MSKNYYKILGVENKASPEDIKKAFHKLAHKYHPDKSGGDEARFKEVSEAYAVLSDEKKRAEYDAYGSTFSASAGEPQGTRGGWDFSGFEGFENLGVDFGDIFSDFFGGRGRERRGRDISLDLQISFKDAVFGTTRTVVITKPSVCEVCEGSGGKPGTGTKTCSTCNGKGKVHETRSSILGTFTATSSCVPCHGKGVIPKERCVSCGGAGVKRKEEEFTVAVPPGVEDGEMIRLTGAGEATSAGVPGDLYVKIHVESDARFRREGQNLISELSLKLTDALLGTTTSFETLEGPISLKVPPGVSHGELLRVKGKGLLIAKGRRGDLLVRIKIRLPQKLSREARATIEKLREEGL